MKSKLRKYISTPALGLIWIIGGVLIRDGLLASMGILAILIWLHSDN